MEPLNHKEFDQYLKNEVDKANFTPNNEWKSIASALHKKLFTSKPKNHPIKWISISALALLTVTGLSYLLYNYPEGYQPSRLITQTNETTHKDIKNKSIILLGEPSEKNETTSKQKVSVGAPPIERKENNNILIKEDNQIQKVEIAKCDLNKSENNLLLEDNFINKKACVFEKVIWEFKEESEELSYLWNFGDGTFSKEKKPTHAYSRAGTYKITLSTKKRKSSEIESRQISGEITVYDKPSAEFDFITEPNGNVRFKALENHENITYKWFVNDKFIASNAVFLLNRSSTGRPLEIKLETYNNASCKSVYKTILNLSF